MHMKGCMVYLEFDVLAHSFCSFFSFSSTQVWSPSSVHYLPVCKLSYLVCSFQPANRSRQSFIHVYALFTKCEVKMAGFCPIFDQDEVAVYKNVKKIKEKKRTRPICSHVDQTSLVKNRFLMCMSNNGCFSCGANASNPELARYKRPILPSWVANQNSGFSSPCPQWETALVNKRL